MKLKRIKFSLVLVILISACRTPVIYKAEHQSGNNCYFNRYINEYLEESDSLYDKAFLIRSRFCGAELCSKKLEDALAEYVRIEKKKVLFVLDYFDTSIYRILSANSGIKMRVDPGLKYQKYGFQRPGHYAFIMNKSGCAQQFIFVDRPFLLAFAEQ